MGDSQETIASGHELLSRLCNVVKHEPDNNKSKKKVGAICADFFNNLSDGQRKVFESSVLNAFLKLIKNTNAWFSFFLKFDPTLSLKKIKVPVLAFFGERDLLVSIRQNLLPFKKSLEASGNTDYTILQMPELNHRFMHCKIGTEIEYDEIEETMSSEVLEKISEWILAKTNF